MISKTLGDRRRIISEGRYDSITRQVVGDMMQAIQYTKDLEDETISIELPVAASTGLEGFSDPHLNLASYAKSAGLGIHGIYKTDRLDFTVDFNISRIPDLYDGLKNVDFILQSYRLKDEDALEFNLFLDSQQEPQSYEKLFYKLNEDVRHEIEHLTQVGKSRIKDRPIPTELEDKNKYTHHTDPTEVPALVHGFYRRAKLEKRPIDEIMIEDLDKEIEDGLLNKKEAQKILDTWIKYSRRRLPHAIYSEY